MNRVKLDKYGKCHSPFGRMSLTKKYCLPDCPPKYVVDKYNHCRSPVKTPRKKRSYIRGRKHSSGVDRSCPRTDGKWKKFTRISKNGRFCYLPCADDKVLNKRLNRCVYPKKLKIKRSVGRKRKSLSKKSSRISRKRSSSRMSHKKSLSRMSRKRSHSRMSRKRSSSRMTRKRSHSRMSHKKSLSRMSHKKSLSRMSHKRSSLIKPLPKLSPKKCFEQCMNFSRC